MSKDSGIQHGAAVKHKQTLRVGLNHSEGIVYRYLDAV